MAVGDDEYVHIIIMDVAYAYIFDDCQPGDEKAWIFLKLLS